METQDAEKDSSTAFLSHLKRYVMPAIEKDALPPSKDLHVFEIPGNTFALDVPTGIGLKIDRAFGAFLQDMEVPDPNLLPVFERRLAALRRRGVFQGQTGEPHQAYQNPVYKLSLEVYHGCNMRCAYCYANATDRAKSDGRRASFETLRQAIDYFVEDFGRDARAYEVNIVGGGEPLLNFDLIRRVKAYCKEVEKRVGKQIVFWIFTNGTVFTDEIVDDLVAERQGVTISLDGPPEVHDALRPFPDGRGSHQVIKKWIKRIQEKSKGLGGIENLWVSTVVTARHRSMRDVLMHLKELGVRSAQIRPIKTLNPGLSITEEDVGALKAQYDEMVDLLIEDAVSGEGELLHIVLNERDFWGRQVIRILYRHRIHYRCGAAKSKLCVLANGDIYPCDIGSGILDLRLGSLKEGIPAEKRYAYYAQEVSQKSSCRDCWCRYFCGGGCYVAAFVRTATIGSPDRAKCELVKRLVELAVRFVSEVGEREPAGLQRVKKYVDVQRSVLNRAYGLHAFR